MIKLGFIALISIIPNIAFGITSEMGEGYWTFSRSKIKSSINIPMTDQPRQIVPSRATIYKRVTKYKKDETIEPLYVSVPKKNYNLRKMANKYAKPKHRVDLYNYLAEAPAGYYEEKKSSKFKKIILNKDALSLIKLGKFRKKLKANHHELTVDAKKLRNDKQTLSRLLSQISYYFNKNELSRIKSTLNNRNLVKVDNHLLASFGKKMVGKYPIYRGPNCFHASVAFQDNSFPTLPKVNLRREPKHHEVMINHDELWRILNTYFYEISPETTDLKYGDILAFFEVPKGGKNKVPNYKWLKHASSYLFGGYVFSKGSKSPNTPYTVKTLDEEWKTWSKFTKNLGVKVFRRSFKNVKRNPPADRTDWLF